MILKDSFDIIYGFYFDPSIFKKNTVVKIIINTVKWRLVLNNDDGFYANCFGEFGIFPFIICKQIYPMFVTCEDLKLDGSKFKVIGYTINRNRRNWV